ncbi:MAG: hypothetical protein EAY81_09925 [Bacteroidetes bacterium]|nr:MAG: hypothetical protein EAY81_09925 [Bacteroidota bacterium]
MKLVLTYILLFLHLVCFAQLQRNYTSYTVDNGLAQNSVWDAFQDYKGFMWFGTADGVNRFDGYKMYHYRPIIGDTNSIGGNSSNKFFEDSKQRLWISHNNGISIYNRVNDCFKNLSFNHLQSHSGETYINILGEDKKGRIWFSDFSDKIWAVSIENFKVVDSILFLAKSHFNRFPRNITISDKYIIGTIYDSTTIWFRLNTETKQFNWFGKLPFNNSSFTVLNDSLLVTYAQKSLYYYNPYTNSLKEQPLSNLVEFNSQKTTIARILKWENNIWIGNNLGLFVIDPINNKLIEFIKRFDKNKDANFSYVQNLYIDKSNNLWICTNGAGVHCISPQRNKFKHLCAKNTSGALVKSITTDADGNVYTGFYADGMVKYNAVRQGKKVELENIKGKLNHVLAITYFNNTLFYVHNENIIAHNNKGINRKKIYTGKYNLGVTGAAISYPFFKPYNNQLFISIDYVIMRLDKNLTTKILLPKGHFDHQITCFELFNDTTWWVGTTKGLYRFNPFTKETVKLKIPIMVKTICAQKSTNKVWVGGNTGLFILTKQGKLVKQFSLSEGLPDDFIYGILEDKYGKLWMSHNKGISLYHPLSKTFKNYSVKDGLQSNEFNTGAYYKDEKGLLYFGGVNGINVIDPNRVVENKNAPQVAINEILLGDMPYKSDTAYNEIRSLTLSYVENTLSFDFSALEFSQPENNTYKYRLNGYDNNWIQSGTKHFARYANLPPGKYVFQVMAANADGFWNNEPRNIFITIIPPFWKRTWFYWLIGLFGFTLLGAAFYVYNKRQQRKLERELEVQQKLEQERLRISRDLHDNVGAQLSYLITNVEWMLQHPDRLTEQDEQQRLQAMSEAGRNAILTLRQTIWAISHKSLNVDDFADRFKQFALKMLEFDKTVQVHFTEQIMPNKELSPAVALNLFRVCQEAFNNCLKHAKSKNIHIHFQSDSTTVFCFKITDDGVGFDWEQAKQKGHYGLVNMEARAGETNAELQVQSSIGKGTTITLLLK